MHSCQNRSYRRECIVVVTDTDNSIVFVLFFFSRLYFKKGNLSTTSTFDVYKGHSATCKKGYIPLS